MKKHILDKCGDVGGLVFGYYVDEKLRVAVAWREGRRSLSSLPSDYRFLSKKFPLYLLKLTSQPSKQTIQHLSLSFYVFSLLLFMYIPSS
jgi:hypothetical protein